MPTPSVPVPWKYRPHLDGLRTVAVYLVVLFHAGVETFGGGFVGVDVFFVLSGFLVTGILIDELNRTGRINLRRFYARRVRRLLPAAALTIVVIGVGLFAFSSPFEQLSRLGGLLSASLYVSNWYFIAQQADYFGSDITASPILHFWSLSVEEQFYFFWPTALTFVAVWARKRGFELLRVIPWVIGGAGVASLLGMVLVAQDNLMRAYYGTDFRAYQLLGGAALALWASKRTRERPRGETRALISGAALVALSIIVMSGLGAFEARATSRGIVTVAACLALISALEIQPNGQAGRLLALPPMVWLGKISYGTYLWHWPIVILLNRTNFELGIPRWLVVAVTATGLAAGSYHWFEQPIRRSEWLGRRQLVTIGGGLVLSVITALTVFVMLTPSQGVQLDWQAAADDTADHVSCFDEAIEECVLRHGEGLTVMLMGDSYAAHWIPGLLVVAEDQDWTLAATTYGNCPWADVTVMLRDEIHQACSNIMTEARNKVVPALHPDLIILVSTDMDRRSIKVGDEVFDPGSDKHTEFMTQAAVTTIEALSAEGTRIALIEQIPRMPESVPECLSTADDASACTFRVDGAIWPVEKSLIAALQGGSDAVAMVDLDRIVCPNYPSCESVTATGVITRADAGHLTTAYSKVIGLEAWSAMQRAFATNG